MKFLDEPFSTSPQSERAARKNRPGARKMSRAHNLLHAAEDAAALELGNGPVRDAYVRGLLSEAAALCVQAIEEIGGESVAAHMKGTKELAKTLKKAPRTRVSKAERMQRHTT